MKFRFLPTAIFVLCSCITLQAQDVIYGPEDPPPEDYTLTFNGTLTDSEIGRTQGKTLYFSDFGLAATTDVYFSTVIDEVKLSMDGNSWDTGEILQFNPGLSDLTGGVLVWEGTTKIPESANTVYTRFTLVAEEQGTGNPIALMDPDPVTGSSYPGGIIHIGPTTAFQVNLRFEAGSSLASLQPALDFYDVASTSDNTAFLSYDYMFYWVNDAPEVVKGSNVEVMEGDTAWLDESHLQVTDSESPDEEIYMTIPFTDPVLPEHGTIYAEDVALGAGDHFTLAQLKAGSVYYVHDDSETTLDNLGLVISDGDGKYYTESEEDSTVVYIPVDITPVDDIPVITVLEILQPNEGEETTITNLYLKTEDSESDAANVTYTFDPDTEGEWPAAGNLKLSSVPLNSGDQFTQADIDNELLTYNNFGTETVADGFYFSVEDGTGNNAVGPGEEVKVFFEIAVTLVNDPPALTVNSPTELDQWTEILIDENHLAAADEESDDAHISFTLEQGVMVTDHGALYLDQTALGEGDVFTMQDILDGKVKYVNNGDLNTSDGIVIQISDEEGAVASDGGFTVFTHQINITLTGVEQPEAELLSIYPNPGSGIFRITWADQFESYTIYNVLGDEVRSGDVRGMQEMELDLRDRGSGVLFLRMNRADRSTETRRFVIR